MSTFNANQVATIENILKCLTPQQVLVVKEHPVDAGALLRGKFQNLRREASGLYYLPAEVHGREILARGARVVTLTSTVGWEAAALGHAVYVLGEIFYDVYPGVIRVEEWPKLRTLLRAPARVPQVAADALEDFVARMVEASVPGNPFPHAGLYSEANRAKVLAAIRGAVLG
jgi:capsule polysaccharide modification protein KpsS